MENSSLIQVIYMGIVIQKVNKMMELFPGKLMVFGKFLIQNVSICLDLTSNFEAAF